MPMLVVMLYYIMSVGRLQLCGDGLHQRQGWFGWSKTHLLPHPVSVRPTGTVRGWVEVAWENGWGFLREWVGLLGRKGGVS